MSKFTIFMGIPEMQELWQKLQTAKQAGIISKDDLLLYNKLGKAMHLLSLNPVYPGLHTHEISALSKRYGHKVWQSYLENNTSKALRIYWVYGPNQHDITIIGISKHPESSKNNAYNKVTLSDMQQV